MLEEINCVEENKQNLKDILEYVQTFIIEEREEYNAEQEEQMGISAATGGLINLPRFYVDFDDYGERNAASDIKKEIISLKNIK